MYKNTKEIPEELKDHLKPDVFEKSRLYEMDKSKLGFASSTFSQFESTVGNNPLSHQCHILSIYLNILFVHVIVIHM